MILYALFWDNGLEYDDHEVTLLGVYTSDDLRQEARARMDGATFWPFYEEHSRGHFVEGEWQTDRDFYHA